jgi:hypothetical protein
MTRRSRTLAAAAALLLVLAPAGRAQEPAPRPLRVYKLPVGGRPHVVAVADLSGDGLRDLLVSHDTADGRRLSLFRQRPGARFAAPADQVVVPPADAVAFLVGDFADPPGEELALLCVDGVRRYARDGAALAPEPARWLGAAGFVEVAPRGALARWDGVIDLDGDGRVDLLVPQRAGYLCAFQLADRSLGRLTALPVTPEERVMSRSFPLMELDLAGSVRMLPRLEPADFDGDGRLDLLALRRAQLTGFLQRAPGFAPTPTFEAEVAFLRPRVLAGTSDEFERKRASFADLDGDRRADLVVLATEGTMGLFSSIKTACTVFRGRAGALYPERPDQVLLLPGAPVRTQVADVTGDGQPDLLATTVRTDLLGAVLDGVSLTTRLYRGVPGGFDPLPVLEDTVDVPLGRLDRGEAVGQQFHGADLTGDGLPDRAEWDPAGRLRIRATVRAGARLAMAEAAWAEGLAPSGVVLLWAERLLEGGRATLCCAWADAVGLALPEDR